MLYVPLPSRARGFTLIEVLAVLVIVGVLMAVALPTYRDSIRKNRRSDAFASLALVQQAQERWRANNPAYTNDLGSTGLNLPTTSSGGYYSIAVTGSAANTYTITATAATGKSQAEDGDCARLRIVMTGAQPTYQSATLSGAFVDASTTRCWAR